MFLSLNTCGSVASIALGVADAEMESVRIVATAELAVRTYSSRLIPEIAAMLESRQATMRDIEAIVVVNGPGSFTGIRVGLSSAKGLAESASIPMVAVSRLAVLAAASGLPHVLAAVDAGRGEYYVGEYRQGAKVAEMLLSAEETVAIAKLPGAGVLVCDESRSGDVATPGTNACAALSMCGPLFVQPPDAAEALRFALGRLRERSFDDAETLQRQLSAPLRCGDFPVRKNCRQMTFSIRPMAAQDLQQVMAIAAAAKEASQWSRLDYEHVLQPASATLARGGWVAEDGAGLVGFAVASHLPAAAEAEIESLVVDAQYRRRGIGSDLLAACKTWAADQGALGLRLEVRASNTAAVALYHLRGFSQAGTAPRLLYRAGRRRFALAGPLLTQRRPL